MAAAEGDKTTDQNADQPPAYQEQPNTKPPSGSNPFTFNEPSTRFTAYSLIFLAVILMNLSIWGYFNTPNDQDESYCENAYEDDNCEWLYLKIAGYSLGLVSCVLSIVSNQLLNIPVINIVSGVLLILSCLLVLAGQSVMVSNEEFLSPVLFCFETDDTSWSRPEYTCCWCEAAALMTIYVLLGILISVDMFSKIGNNPKIRLIFYFVSYMLVSIFLMASYFDEEKYNPDYVDEIAIFQLFRASIIIVFILSIIVIVLVFIPLSNTLQPILFKIIAVLFVVFVLHIILYWHQGSRSAVVVVNVYMAAYGFLVGDCGQFIYGIFAVVSTFELVTFNSNLSK